MKLIILEDYSQASEWAAKYIRNRIIQFNPGPDKYFTLGLPTGALWVGGCWGSGWREWASET
jgi:glucosamine-6-phosphate deaminase